MKKIINFQTLADILRSEGIQTARPSTKELAKNNSDFEPDLNNNEVGLANMHIV